MGYVGPYPASHWTRRDRRSLHFWRLLNSRRELRLTRGEHVHLHIEHSPNVQPTLGRLSLASQRPLPTSARLSVPGSEVEACAG